MSKTKSTLDFSVGDAVRVKFGVTDPDFPDIPFGGWAGTISNVEDGLFCQARRDGKRIELPLTEVELGKGNLNRRLVEDYSCWFVNS